MTTRQVDRFAAENVSVDSHPENSNFSECLQQPKQAFDNAVQERPMTTVMTCFGIGLGVGALIGCAIATQSTSRTRQLENWRERMMGSMGGAVPDSFKHYFKG